MDSTTMLTSMANDGATGNVLCTVRPYSAGLCSVRHEPHRTATQQLSTFPTQLMRFASLRRANKALCSYDIFFFSLLLLLYYFLHGSTQQAVPANCQSATSSLYAMRHRHHNLPEKNDSGLYGGDLGCSRQQDGSVSTQPAPPPEAAHRALSHYYSSLDTLA